MYTAAVDAAALRHLRGQRLGRALRRLERTLAWGETLLWPWLDLGIRLWLAQIFLVSGLLKVANWDTALTLAAYEYPVRWLDPYHAALLGAAVELVCPVLLALGLATRLAAVPLLLLSLVIELEYRHLAEHLDWIVLFAGYAVLGAGPLSLDRLLARGTSSSALPLVDPLLHLYGAISRYLGPLFWLAVRAWLAWSLVQTATTPPAEALAVLLLVGLATRPAALVAALLLASAADAPYLLMLAAMLLLRGGGAVAVDAVLWQVLQRRYPRLAGMSQELLARLPQVVVVGGGFGGLAAVRALRDAPCRVTLIDRHNYHLFQPLLYQVATASLNPADIAVPIRELLRDQDNARVLLGRVSGVDTRARAVLIGEQRIPYDYLVLATGARHSYFGRDEWEPWALGLKRIDDATAIRRRLLLAFERAETCTDPLERQRLLTFVIIGGGPTGVELAGAVAELAHHGLADEFRHIDPAQSRVLLLEAGPRLLATFPEQLSAITERSLRALGVEVLTGARVEVVDGGGVVVGGQRIGARCVFWAAGVMASPAAEWLGVEADRAGRVKVGADLSVPGLPEVFAIGDTAYAEAWDGKPAPGLAPAAKQGGAYVAKVIGARLEERNPPPPFRYHHLGSLATIGRQAAVADFGWLRLSGAAAWWLWGVAHIAFLASLRSRVAVALSWFWAYLTFRRGTRLVTGGEEG
ncbi:MAG TPA: FAD-dependent oxidoreductase [Candidatus Competibacteraceae bacterium]|nr:FAD-dependent oxidoreductase [Candidatus Competibacteraceae bacterium]